jgi:hypothetical protein
MIEDIKSVLQSNECPLNRYSKARVCEIEKSVGFLGICHCKELIEIVPIDLNAERILGRQSYSASLR